jgi:hypothetical protein
MGTILIAGWALGAVTQLGLAGCGGRTTEQSEADADRADAPVEGDPPPAAACGDARCEGPGACHFAIADGCAAKPSCLSHWVERCFLKLEYCGCDGTIVLAGCMEPDGYATAPVSGLAPCAGGINDGGH